jgi:hypothetical protein
MYKIPIMRKVIASLSVTLDDVVELSEKWRSPYFAGALPRTRGRAAGSSP